MNSYLSAVESSCSEIRVRRTHTPPPATTSTIAPQDSGTIKAGDTAPAASYRLNYYNAGNNTLSLFDDPFERPVFEITTKRARGGARNGPSLQRTVVKLLPTSAPVFASSSEVNDEQDIVKGEINWKDGTVSVGDISIQIGEIEQKCQAYRVDNFE
jgi:hypothetical protein